jgi:hypothetical protein
MRMAHAGVGRDWLLELRIGIGNISTVAVFLTRAIKSSHAASFSALLLRDAPPPPGARTRRGGLECTNCRAWLAGYLEPQGIDPLAGGGGVAQEQGTKGGCVA